MKQVIGNPYWQVAHKRIKTGKPKKMQRFVNDPVIGKSDRCYLHRCLFAPCLFDLARALEGP